MALSIVVNVEETAEMSIAEDDKRPEPMDELGVPVTVPIRNYVNESNYQYGIRAGGPRVLELLDRHRITATAQSLERAPELTRHIVDAGHEVSAHGRRWVHQFSLDEEWERTLIEKAATSMQLIKSI